jgi:hypothetical protein
MPITIGDKNHIKRPSALVNERPAVIEQPLHAVVPEQAVHVAVGIRRDDGRNVRAELIAQVAHHLRRVLVLQATSAPSTVVVDAPMRAEEPELYT